MSNFIYMPRTKFGRGVRKAGRTAKTVGRFGLEIARRANPFSNYYKKRVINPALKRK